MKLTRASDYGIRLLTCLASGCGEGTSEEFAKKLDIPFNHLAKLVQVLARRGFLVTTKGKGGGLKLAVDPRKINLAGVIEAIEGPLVMSDCIFHRESCRFSAKCRIRRVLAKARDKMNSVFLKTTIFDLATTKTF